MTDRPGARSLQWAAPLAVFLGATAISLVGAGVVSYWTDEAAALSSSRRTIPELWAMLQNVDAVHGFYYVLLHAWINVFGDSSLSTRALSALAIGGTCLGVYFVGKNLVDMRFALIAAAVAALLPRLTWAGIEARPSAFTALCAVWATYLLLRAWARGSWWAWTGYAVVGFVGILFNIYLVLLLLAHGVSTVLVHRKHRRLLIGFGAAVVAACLLALPLILLARGQQAQLGTRGDRSPLSLIRKALVNMLFLGETPSAAANPAWFTLAWQGASVVLAILCLGLILLAVLRRTWAAPEQIRTTLAVSLPWLVLPPLLVVAYAVVVAPLFQPRYFTFVAPAAALLIAAGIRAIPARWGRVAVAVALIALALVVYASQRTPYAKNGTDWNLASGVIADATEPGDVMYFTPRYDYEGPIAHVTARRMTHAYPEAFDGLEDLTLVRTPIESASIDGDSMKLVDAAEELVELDRLWVVYGKHGVASVIEEDEETLSEAGFEATETWSGPRTVIVLYERVP